MYNYFAARTVKVWVNFCILSLLGNEFEHFIAIILGTELWGRRYEELLRLVIIIIGNCAKQSCMALALVRCSIEADQGGTPHVRARVSLVGRGEVMHCCLWFRSVFRVRGPWPKRYGYHLSIN